MDPARQLLRELDELDGVVVPGRRQQPGDLWAASGGMALTGAEHGPPLMRNGPAVALDAALRALHALAPGVVLPDVRLLGERAAIAGLKRRGQVSCGGASRLMRCADGWAAVTLARREDEELLPALVEAEVTDPWTAVEQWLECTPVALARERARLLGLPLGVVGEVQSAAPWVVTRERAGARPRGRPRVIDLSALWAGPLCASLLRALGCEVLKVEDPARPDGARRGPSAFFKLMNVGATEVPVRFSAERERLGALIRSADVVIESSRPRALEQLGIVVDEIIEDCDITWVSITAHGRDQGDRVGYGDDAAAAGGLVRWMGPEPVFVGDAIADPLSGVLAALAAWSGLRAGGARLIDVALSRVAAYASSLEATSAALHCAAAPWARDPG